VARPAPAEQAIADSMDERAIDRREAIEVQHDHRALGFRRQPRKRLGKTRPVRQTRKRVFVGNS
jgi:hypothetical protein